MGLSGFLNSVVRRAAQVGRAFTGVAAPAIRAVVQSAKALIDGFFTGAGQGMREEPKTSMERNERNLQEINEEIMRLKARHRSNGSLNAEEKQRWQYLKARRDELNRANSEIDQVVTAAEVVKEEEQFSTVVIDDSTAHILQYHVGQSTHDKMCVCGRAMVLQWNRKTATAGLRDFFWACSGWYDTRNEKSACYGRQALTLLDLNLFANLSRPEFKISSSELTQVTMNPSKAKRIRQALDSIKNSHEKKRLGIATYRCPIHGESLRLKRKNQLNDELLDDYFLGCPRWLPNKNGCNFLVKLKSAAQISSVLDTEQGRGVLDT